MTVHSAINELSLYVGLQFSGEVSLHMATPGSIAICLTVAKIVKEFNSTQNREDRVCELLAFLLGKHFNK